MKKIKLLFAVLAVLTGLIRVSAGPVYTEKIDYSWSFYCPCAGEWLDVQILVNYVDNGIIEHYNVMGGTMTGEDSGDTYRFIDAENYKVGDEMVIVARFIHKGVVRTDQVVFNGKNLVSWGGCGN